MNAAVALDRTRGDSPRTLARLLGGISILLLITAAYAQGYVSERLVVSGDATTTAANIVTHRGLFMSAFSVYLVEMACNIVTVALGYLLLKPAGPRVAFVAVCLGLIGCTIKTMARVFFAAPMLFLGGRIVLHAITPGAQNELALVLLAINDRAAGMAMAFFGFQTLLDGYLTLRSTFLPRALGVLSMVAGAGMLIYLWPPAVHRAFPFVIGLALLGLVVKLVWLLTFGVNEERWYERARAIRG